uniref:Uncharacterized protein n=1 Tax=Moniliophthora roreri TaxID=221103 RepID=A0A0W0FLX4_MONRR
MVQHLFYFGLLCTKLLELPQH